MARKEKIINKKRKKIKERHRDKKILVNVANHQ